MSEDEIKKGKSKGTSKAGTETLDLESAHLTPHDIDQLHINQQLESQV